MVRTRAASASEYEPFGMASTGGSNKRDRVCGFWPRLLNVESRASGDHGRENPLSTVETGTSERGTFWLGTGAADDLARIPSSSAIISCSSAVCGGRRIVGAQSHSSMCAVARSHLPVPALIPTPSLWRGNARYKPRVPPARAANVRSRYRLLMFGKIAGAPLMRATDSFEKMAGKAGGRA
jgi:hypothetical protein